MTKERSKEGQRSNVEIVEAPSENPYGDGSYDAIKRRHNEVKPSKEGFVERAQRVLKEIDEAQ